MTDQYAQRDINRNGKFTPFASLNPGDNLDLPPYSQLSVVTAGDVTTVTLPKASDAGPNSTVTVFKSAGAAGDTVQVVAAAGDSIASGVGAANPIVLVGGSITLKSFPLASGWLVVGNTV